jgi:hypothetical protein
LDQIINSKTNLAQCIPLDIPSFGLDNKAHFNLKNLPLNKLKFVVVKYAIHASFLKKIRIH